MNPADAQPQPERSLRRGAFVTLFAIVGSHALLETARDALFLANVPAERLPLVYLGGTAVAAVVSLSAGLRRGSARTRLLAIQGFAAVVTLAFAGAALLLGPRSVAVYYALYVWSGVIASVLVVAFWLALADLFTITQGKRLYASIGTGGAMGALAGFSLATGLSTVLPTEHLLTLAGLGFAASAAGPLFLLQGEPLDPLAAGPTSDDELPGLRECLEKVRESRYARHVGAVVILGTVTVTLGDYLFKSELAKLPAEQLATWVGGVHTVLNALSLALLAGLVGPLLRRVPLHGALAVLPVAMLVTGAAFTLVPALAAVLALKTADGSLRYSLQKTCQELLYLPLPQDLRAPVKGFVELMGQHGARALASLGILALAAPHGLTLAAPQLIGATLVVVAGGWALASWRLRDPYLEMFRTTLAQGSIETRIRVPDLDLASLETLIRALNHPDERHVVAALDLLATRSRVDLIPGVILYHPSTAVLRRALDLFAHSDRDDFVGHAPRLLEHEDAEVRAATVRALARARPDRERLHELAHSACPVIRASALAGLAANGFLPAAEAAPGLEAARVRALEEHDPGVRLAIAHAIEQSPDPAYEDLLRALLHDPEPGVRRETVRAACESRDPRYTPLLVAHLGDRDIRELLRRALVERGAEGLAALADALESPETPARVLRHVPQSIARFGSREAAAILLAHVTDQRLSGIVRYKILRGLSALADAAIPLDRRVLQGAVEESLDRTRALIRWQAALEEGATGHPERDTCARFLLIEILEDKQRLALQRIFRMLYLQNPDEDFRRMWQGLHSGYRVVRASSAELVENLVPREQALSILGLTADGSTRSRMQAADVGAFEGGYGDLIRELQRDRSDTLRGLAAYHAAELGGFLGDETREPPGDPSSERLLERAMALLERLPDPAPATLREA